MATKTLTITTEAYDLLKARKKENESFSKAINRLLKGHTIFDLAGVLTEKQSQELRNRIHERRMEMRREMDNRIKRLL